MAGREEPGPDDLRRDVLVDLGAIPDELQCRRLLGKAGGEHQPRRLIGRHDAVLRPALAEERHA